MSESSTLRPHALGPEEAQANLELQRLAWAYCHAVDRGDMALLESLYHPDAIDDHGAMFRGSPEEYVAWLPRMLKGLEATRHTIHNMLFLVDGDRAQGELVNTAYHRTRDGREIILGGRYLDEYERREGVWRILRRSLVLDSFEERPAQTAEGFIGKGVERGSSDEGDPVFTRLALFGQQRG